MDGNQEIWMRGVCSWTVVILAILASTSAIAMLEVPAGKGADLPARASAVGDPVAVITPLPDYVSNGSWYDLNATDSYDTDGGFIKDYFWEIELNDSLETSHASLHRYMFKELGLYKITLTVTDNLNQTNRSFTAVVSVLDTDGDQMADWWEEQYFSSLDPTGTGDYDQDGYTNLEEYVTGTDPTVKDPQPNFVDTMAAHWYVFVLVAAIIVGIGLSIWPFLRRRRLSREKKKIEAAIEIEKELEREERG